MEVYRRQLESKGLRLTDPFALAVVCVVAAFVRILPQLVAYPYPIGYDVVNYYIPVTANLDNHWQEIAHQFPFYAIILHSISVATSWNPELVVAFLATLVFSAFAASVYALARKAFGLNPKHAGFLALFVIFQVSVLRTTWDLHRDMLALTGAVGAIAFLNGKKLSWSSLAFCLLASTSDRMVGIFLIATLAIHGFIRKQKPPLVQAAVSAVVLVAISGTWAITPISLVASGISHAQQIPPSNYTPTNLMVLFLVMDGLLIAPASYGFLRLRKSPVAVSALIALAGSFTWIVLPDHAELAADRWIVLSGIWLSILGGYGIVSYGQELGHRLKKMLLPFALASFAILGVAYVVSPYEHPFFLFALANNYSGTFSPPTMQFSVLDVKDTPALIDSIKSVNLQTEPNSVIVGSKDWRGFMEQYLTGGRQYRFSDSPSQEVCIVAHSARPAYLFTFSGTRATVVPSSVLCG